MSEQRWSEVLQLLQQQQSLPELDEMLSLLLSLDERHSIGGRLAVIRELLKGELSQRQISAQLGVSIATITRASNNLKLMSEAERERIKQQLQH